MVAELFKVRSWLEEPAKWLEWARVAVVNDRDKDAEWNFKQYWDTMPNYRKQAKTSQDWAEILTLDAQSELFLANYLRRQIYIATKDGNRGAVVDLQTRQSQALAKASEYNRLAQAKYNEAKVTDHQAKNAAVVLENRSKRLPQEQKIDLQKVKAVSENTFRKAASDTLEDLAKGTFGGLPIWAWAAIVFGVLVITQTASVSTIHIGRSADA